MTTALVLVLLAFGVLGALAARWAVLVVPAFAWTLYFTGRKAGWWGSGLGDGWEAALTLLILSSTVAVAAGVALRKATRSSRNPDRSS